MLKTVLFAPVFLSSLFLLTVPAYAATALEQAQTLIKSGKNEQALGMITSVLEKEPQHIEARFMQGILLTRLNRIEEAEQAFIRLTQDKPELPEPYNNLAVIYAAQGKFEEARHALTQAINTHPSYATAHENLGDIYAKMASRAYNQALELDVDNLNIREKLLLINELFPVQQSGRTSVAMNEDTTVKPVTGTTPPVTGSTAIEAVKKDVIPEKVEPEPDTTDDDANQKILTRIDEWAQAWSAQDIDAYLGFYSSEFTPTKNMTLSSWKAQRRKRLVKPSFIRVSYESPQIKLINPGLARVTFSQSYQSDNYSDRVKKALILRLEDGDWNIVEEKNL